MTFPVRLGRPSDMAYVMDSWRRHYFEGCRVQERWCPGSPAVVGADRDHYFDASKATIGYLCRTGSFRVAHAPNDEDHLIGFVAHTGKTFHFGAIKGPFWSDLKVGDMLDGIELDSYTFRCPYLELLLDGFRGSYIEEVKTGTGGSIKRWHPPTGWRFTPRI